jgi:hypothetical protein
MQCRANIRMIVEKATSTQFMGLFRMARLTTIAITYCSSVALRAYRYQQTQGNYH